jgi:hypothetical protein
VYAEEVDRAMTQLDATQVPPLGTRRATEAVPRRTNAVIVWAVVGAVFLVFEVFVLSRWMSGPNFAPRPVERGSVPELTRAVIGVTQVISPVVCAFIVGRFLLWPLARQRRLTFDGMLVIAYLFLWFQDPMGNLIGTQLYYSSAWVNMGSWTLGSFPGWVNPTGDRLPEPILVMGFGYLWLGFLSAVAACALMGRLRARWPRMSGAELMLGALVLGVVLDIAAEVSLAAAGVFAWPGAIHGLSLFPERPYRFPMYEGVLFGAVIVAGGVLKFFRDDRGNTLVERGAERLRLPRPAVTGLRFLAVFGFLHLFMAVVYSVPMVFFGLYSADPLPRYPAHLENGMCVVKATDQPCRPLEVPAKETR